MSADPLLMAKVMTERPAAFDHAAWARSAILLARQAVEDAVSDIFAATVPAMTDRSFRSQFVALPFYVTDDDLGRRAHQLWSELSAACHPYAYDLAPSLPEVRDWIERAETIRRGLQPIRVSGGAVA